MEIVRSPTSRDIHNTAGGAPVLSREVTCDDAELADRIKRYLLTDAGHEIVHVLATVEQNVCASRALTVDRETRTAARRVILVDVARDRNQVIGITSRGWKLANFRGGNYIG